MDAVRAGSPLSLQREAKLVSLLAPVAPGLDRLEASGITIQDGLLWIIFDNLPDIGAIHPDLVPGAGSRLVRQQEPSRGYEDIAHDDDTGRRFILIESASAPDGGWRPQIDEYDSAWIRTDRRWVDLEIEDPNKGLEGLTCLRRDGRMYLLALSEGNGNRGGRLGRRPGKGVVHVLAEKADAWEVVSDIQLPGDLPFTDYSALSVRGDRIAVVSQESSQVWVGALDPMAWRIADAGVIHEFPRDDHDRIVYGTVEGICWVDDQTFAVVSDRAKRRQPDRFRAKAESVHVFALP